MTDYSVSLSFERTKNVSLDKVYSDTQPANDPIDHV